MSEGKNGWRADIVLEWSNGAKARLELKLGAPFTANQRSALTAGEIDLIIAPHRDLSTALTNGAKVVTWIEVLEQATPAGGSRDLGLDAALLLLREASDSFGWYLESISREELHVDAIAMFDNAPGPGRKARDWMRSWKFLVRIEAELESVVPPDWTYAYCGDRIPKPNPKHRYYGFRFNLAPDDQFPSQPWWIGIMREQEQLFFRLYFDEETLVEQWPTDEGLNATALVGKALAAIRNHYR